MLLLNCHTCTHLSACCYCTFQRVAVTFWSWSVTDVGSTRPITSTEVWPPRPSCYISMTPRAQSVTDIWPCGPIQLHKHDLVGPTSYTSMTLWAQPVTQAWPCGPSQLQKYDLGPTATEVRPSEPSPYRSMGLLACTELVIVCIRQRAPAITIITLIYSERKEHTSARILYDGTKLVLALFLVDAI